MSHFTMGKAMDNIDKSLDDIMAERKSILKRNQSTEKMKKKSVDVGQIQIVLHVVQCIIKCRYALGQTTKIKNAASSENQCSTWCHDQATEDESTTPG